MARRIGRFPRRSPPASASRAPSRPPRRSEGSWGSCSRERAEAFHLSPAVRVLAADGRSQERWKSQPDRGVTLVDEHRILRAPPGITLMLSWPSRGAARPRRRDVVPAAARGAARPREASAGRTPAPAAGRPSRTAQPVRARGSLAHRPNSLSPSRPCGGDQRNMGPVKAICPARASALVLAACSSKPRRRLSRRSARRARSGSRESALSDRQLSSTELQRPLLEADHMDARSATTTRRRRCWAAARALARLGLGRPATALRIAAAGRRSFTPSARGSAPTSWRRPSTPEAPISFPRIPARRRVLSTRASGWRPNLYNRGLTSALEATREPAGRVERRHARPAVRPAGGRLRSTRS